MVNLSTGDGHVAKISNFAGMGRLMAIDYGRRRCGVAVTDPSRIVATALATVPTAELTAFIKNI